MQPSTMIIWSSFSSSEIVVSGFVDASHVGGSSGLQNDVVPCCTHPYIQSGHISSGPTLVLHTVVPGTQLSAMAVHPLPLVRFSQEHNEVANDRGLEHSSQHVIPQISWVAFSRRTTAVVSES